MLVFVPLCASSISLAVVSASSFISDSRHYLCRLVWTDFVFPVSCGEDFFFSKTPSETSLQQMQRLSPIQFVSAVQTPLLLALGAKDQRVRFSVLSSCCSSNSLYCSSSSNSFVCCCTRRAHRLSSPHDAAFALWSQGVFSFLWRLLVPLPLLRV